MFRLRGKGIKGVRSNTHGDLLCHVVVETPVKLTERQKELLHEFESIDQRNAGMHNPRRRLDEKGQGVFRGVAGKPPGRVGRPLGTIAGFRSTTPPRRVHPDRSLRIAALVSLAEAIGLAAVPASAQVRIGLMVSATGPTSAIGIPQEDTGELLPARIGDTTIKYFQLDDGGDTTRAVQNVKKPIQEQKVDAIIGPSTTPNALAILDVIAENEVPLMATISTQNDDGALERQAPLDVNETRNDDLISRALIGHMLKNKVKTVGFIGLNDPYGENWAKVFSSHHKGRRNNTSRARHYSRTDQSMGKR